MRRLSLGIDQSFTSTGVVLVRSGRTKPISWDRIKTTTKDTHDDRIRFIIDNILGQIQAHVPDIVCLESVAYGMVGKGQVFQLGELSGAIKSALHYHEQRYEVANIGSWKKMATGNGNAGKPLVAKAARSLWPDCPMQQDVMDAYHIARYGLDILGALV